MWTTIVRFSTALEGSDENNYFNVGVHLQGCDEKNQPNKGQMLSSYALNPICPNAMGRLHKCIVCFSFNIFIFCCHVINIYLLNNYLCNPDSINLSLKEPCDF